MMDIRIKKTESTQDIKELQSIVKEHKRITLVFAAKDTEHNNAAALRDFLNNGDL